MMHAICHGGSICHGRYSKYIRSKIHALLAALLMLPAPALAQLSPPPDPVQSVAGRTGAVTISLGDVAGAGALAALSGLSGLDASNATVTATGSATARSAAARAADVVNVKNFGAMLNGTTDNSVAFQNARNATPANGTIFVPGGGYDVTTPPTGSSSLLWQLSGNGYGTGTTPVLNVGPGDLVETFFSGTKYFGKLNNPTSAQPALRLDDNLTTAGGTNGWVSPGFEINATSASGVTDSLWGILLNLNVNSNANASGWPQPVGMTIDVAKNATAQSWGESINIADTQGVASSVGGGFNGIEMGMQINGADDANGSGGGSRRFIDLIASTYGSGTAGFMGNGVLVRTLGNASITDAFHALGGNVTNGFVADGAYDGFVAKGSGATGLDVSGATLSGPAIRLAGDQRISLEASDTIQMYYDLPTGKLIMSVGGANKFSVDSSGDVAGAAASFTGAVTAPSLALTGAWAQSGVLAGPAGGSGAPSVRALSHADLSDWSGAVSAAIALPGGFRAGTYHLPRIAGATISTSTAPTNNQLVVAPVFIPAGSATLKSVSIELAGTVSTAYSWSGCVYADSGAGAPGTLVPGGDTGNQSNTIPTTGSGARTATASFPAALSLVSGWYWVGIMTGSGAGGAIYAAIPGTTIGDVGTLIGATSIAGVTSSSGSPGFAGGNVSAYGACPAAFGTATAAGVLPIVALGF